MKKTIIIILVLIGVLLIILIRSKVYAPTADNKQEAIPSKNGSQAQTVKPTPISDYYYPITDYNQRIQIHSYGTLVKPGDEKALICGRAFSGYHAGDDLEIKPGEASIDVSIKAIAAGTVREVSWVSGYGGLVVIEHSLNGQAVTAYYGHMNTNSVYLKTGDTVAAGQAIGNLGQGCSQQTDYERKHLHFDIHKGTTLDVRGYVPSLSILSQWLDPKAELASIGAK
jgi:murein DD-endopeptidase MepM/ murein hydrolase activator NlpD